MKTLLLSEKRLQKDFSEKWQVLSPFSNTWVTLKIQSDKWNEHRNKKIVDSNKEIFTYEVIQDTLKALRDGLDFPYIHCYASTLGGQGRVAILFTISEDKKEDWAYGILENSRYRRFHIVKNGTVENFSCGVGVKKLRKFKGKSIQHIVEKINQ